MKKPYKQPPQPLQLVVGQSIHGIEEQSTNSWSELFVVFFLAHEVVENRHQEALSLAASGPGGDHEVTPVSSDFPDGLFLVNV